MTDSSDDEEIDGEEADSGEADTGETSCDRTGRRHVCRATGRKQGLVGKYDIWLSRQAFREMAHDMGGTTTEASHEPLTADSPV